MAESMKDRWETATGNTKIALKTPFIVHFEF